MKPISLMLMLLLIACNEPAPPVADRAMDEVPVQQILPGGDREYRFANGCVIVLQPKQAVVKTESAACELYHRDIALLYASAD